MLHGARCQSCLTHFSGVHYTHETEPILLNSDFDIYRKKMKWKFRDEDFKRNPYQIFYSGSIPMSLFLEDPPCLRDKFLFTAGREQPI